MGRPPQGPKASARARRARARQSLGTKDPHEAKRRAVAVLADFNKTLDQAEALLLELPLRTSLSQSEIDRIAEFYYASVLAGDEEFTSEGGKADDDLVMREALARGDISKVDEAMTELLDRFHLNLDRNSASYRKLGLAVLSAEVRALNDLARRYCGQPIETPPMAHLEPSIERPSTGGTLCAAFAGWKKQRERSAGTSAEYERAIELFIQLHGDLPVATITRDHARTFREALQGVPWPRPGELAKATLPALVEWRRTHPDAPRITSRSVNKQFGGVQAIVNWARENGMIPDHSWTDPFSKMRVEEDDPEGGPFEADELRTLFASPVFNAGERPKAGQGDVAFWLPMLALFTGARRAELATLQAADISKDEATQHWTLAIYADKDTGKKLKTKGSARTIPVHPELVRLGFLTFVEAARKGGNDGWLFPPVSPAKPAGAKAWTKWFGRYLDGLGIKDGGPTTNRSVGQAPERLKTSECARKAGAVRRKEATAIPVLYRPARRQPGLSSHTRGAHNGKLPDQGRPMQPPQ